MSQIGFDRLQWLFPIAVVLHNSEEAVTMPAWSATHRGLPLHPSTAKIWCGLLLLTVAAFALTYLSTRKGKESVSAYLFFGYVVAMLVNVFIPHIPATLALGEYTPGVITAVFINLPVMSLLAFKAVEERWVSGKKAIAYAMLVPLGLGITITAFLVIG